MAYIFVSTLKFFRAARASIGTACVAKLSLARKSNETWRVRERREVGEGCSFMLYRELQLVLIDDIRGI